MIMGAQSEGEYADRGDHGRARWQRRYDNSRLRNADFTTLSGLAVDPVYGPPEGAVVPGFERIGWPGEFPFTRGLYPAGYRGRTWTIRQFSGFGNAVRTNQRYTLLLPAAGRGLLAAIAPPTHIRRHPPHPPAVEGATH